MKDKPLYEVTQIRDLRELIKKRVKDHPENPCFLVKEQKGGEYVPIMPDKYDKDIDGLGTALMTLVNKGAKVAILGETRYEWFVSYLAVTNGTGCVVPLDKELPADEIESMLERADVEILIFSKAKLEAVEAVYGKVPSVKHYICMDKLDDTKYSYFWDVVKKGTDLIASGDKTFIDTTIDPDEMTILLFTSGTTAKSKAVMLCQKNICKNLMSMYSFVYIDPKDVFMSVLPLHHTYECTCGFLGQVYVEEPLRTHIDPIFFDPFRGRVYVSALLNHDMFPGKVEVEDVPNGVVVDLSRFNMIYEFTGHMEVPGPIGFEFTCVVEVDDW